MIAKHTGKVQGKVLDLGSGGGKYNDYFHPSCVIEDVDFYKGSKYSFDLNEKFPLPSLTYDCVFSTSVIEHLYNPKNMVSESYRVLKKGGVFMFSAPFLHPYHRDPVDCFRYVKDGVINMLENAGFSEINIEEMGGRFSFLLDIFRVNNFASLILSPFVPVVRYLDSRLLSNFEKRYGRRYHFGYFVVARK
jgi:SAM-dependent methyltransferase